jgi:antitoxin MazE6
MKYLLGRSMRLEGKTGRGWGTFHPASRGRFAERYDAGHTCRVKTAISLPDRLFEAADRLARRLGISRNELYAAALGEYLRSHRDEGVTEALNRVYQEEDSSPDPILEALQETSLSRDEW